MSKYEVWATVWCNTLNSQVKICVGEFTNYINASIFKDAYNEHYYSDASILEYKLVK